MDTVCIEHVPTYNMNATGTGVRKLLAPLGSMAAFVCPGDRVLIKPNLLMAKSPEAAVTTHPDVIRAVIEEVKEVGGIPLVGDSPGFGSYRTVAEQTGVAAVCRETGAELIEFNETVEVQGAGIFKKIRLAQAYLAADRVINLPKLKTHEMMTMTCAVKNIFGAVVGSSKAGWHLKAGADRDIFARMILEICLLRPPDLTIVDAITAMEGPGPSSGYPRQVGLLLAGKNPVAVDVIAAELAGIPKKLLFIEQAARKLKLPGACRDSIVTVGFPFEEARCLEAFQLPPLGDVQFGLPRFVRDRLRHYLTTRPVVDSSRCVLCGVCRDACPPAAITIAERMLTINYRSCIRCFCCRELCPHKAFDVSSGTVLRWAERLAKINNKRD